MGSEMILFRILLITVLNGAPVDRQEIAVYELRPTLENCQKNIKPAFDRYYVAKDSYKMELKTVTECIKL